MSTQSRREDHRSGPSFCFAAGRLTKLVTLLHWIKISYNEQQGPDFDLPFEVLLPEARPALLYLPFGGTMSTDDNELDGVGKPREIAVHVRTDELLPTGNKCILRFNLVSQSVGLMCRTKTTPWNLVETLNSKEWMGKEAGSCKVIHIRPNEAVHVGKTAIKDHAEFVVLVGYRPDGWISDVSRSGRRRLNGWRLEVRDWRHDGTYLDGHGHWLPAGTDPVYVPHANYRLADYNKCDFGRFLGLK